MSLFRLQRPEGEDAPVPWEGLTPGLSHLGSRVILTAAKISRDNEKELCKDTVKAHWYILERNQTSTTAVCVFYLPLTGLLSAAPDHFT